MFKNREITKLTSAIEQIDQKMVAALQPILQPICDRVDALDRQSVAHVLKIAELERRLAALEVFGGSQ